MVTGVEFWKSFLLSDGTSGAFLMDPHDPNGGLIEVYGDVGLILVYSSPFLESINTNNEEEILKILDGDISDIDPNDIGHLYLHLGSLKSQNSSQESLDYYQKAVDVFIDNKEYFFAAGASERTAYIIHELGNKKEAADKYLLAGEQYLLADAKDHADFVREIANRIKIRMQPDAGKETGVVEELDFQNKE